MAITRFQDLPSENSPINSENLNGNFDELGVKVGTSVDNNYRTNIIKSKNLFNINDITPNNFLNSDTGNISSSTSWSTSNYIEVNSSTSYVLNYVRSGASNTTICFYNNSKAFISSVSTSTLGLPATFTTPSNAKYLRFDYKSADNQTNIQLEKGSTATTYKPYVIPKIVVDNEEIYTKGQNEVYSTAEQVIGTWIDGKPLYRKVITSSNLSANTNNSISVSNYSTMSIKKIDGHYLAGGSNFVVPLNVANGADTSALTNHRSTCYFNASSGNLISYCGSYFTGNNKYDAYIIIEYTKSTD